MRLKLTSKNCTDGPKLQMLLNLEIVAAVSKNKVLKVSSFRGNCELGGNDFI